MTNGPFTGKVEIQDSGNVTTLILDGDLGIIEGFMQGEPVFLLGQSQLRVGQGGTIVGFSAPVLLEGNGELSLGGDSFDGGLSIKDSNSLERIRVDAAGDTRLTVQDKDGNTTGTIEAAGSMSVEQPAATTYTAPALSGSAWNVDAVGVLGWHQGSKCEGVLGKGGGPSGRGFGDESAGVYGRAGTFHKGGSGLAGLFDGEVRVYGDLRVIEDLFVYQTLSGPDKQCKIDHPLEPENKFLIHACVESSERVNIYRGSVRLNTRGEATIRLPKWTQAFNTEFEYQLTPIGAPAPDLHVATEISDSRFKIAGGPPGIRVSWQITGVRADAYATQHPMRVEVPKRGAERGTYLHPVEHGSRTS
jgi:hypothetical protein